MKKLILTLLLALTPTTTLADTQVSAGYLPNIAVDNKVSNTTKVNSNQEPFEANVSRDFGPVNGSVSYNHLYQNYSYEVRATLGVGRLQVGPGYEYSQVYKSFGAGLALQADTNRKISPYGSVFYYPSGQTMLKTDAGLSLGVRKDFRVKIGYTEENLRNVYSAHGPYIGVGFSL